MNNEPNPLLLKIDPVCEVFESALQGESRPSIDEFLGDWEGDARETLFRHLLELEVDYRITGGESVAAEEYTSQFPEYAEVIEELTSFETEGNTRKTIDADSHGGLVLGNYVVLEKIGEGGMGTVFKARHQRMERVVALKVLSKALTKNPDALKRFQREVVAAARLVHPHIVTAYDADEAKGVHFLVMEYVEGEDLASLVKGAGPLPISEAVRCIIQAGTGLIYAHSRGVIHRDIKPANLLLDKHGVVKVLDMGLARMDIDVAHHASLTNSGTVMGTIDYMSPEQAANSKGVDARADIYSLGISLWYLLTGKAAYEADSLIGKIVAHRERPIPSLVDPCPETPPELDAVFRKMVAKEADDRFGTMKEAVASLSICLDAEGQDGASTLDSTADDPLLASFLASNGSQQPSTQNDNSQTAAFAATIELSNPTVETAPTIELSPSVPATQPVRQRDRNRNIAIGLGAGLLMVLFGALVIYLRTLNGTVRIEILDPSIDVVLNSTGATIKGVDGFAEIKLVPGTDKLKIHRGDFEFFTDDFELKKGEDVLIRVEYLAGEVNVVKDGMQLPVRTSANAHDGKIAGTKRENADGSRGSEIADVTDRPALLFDHPGSYVDVPSIPIDFSQPFCLESWCDPRDLAHTKSENRVIAILGPCQLNINKNRLAQAVLVDILNKKKPLVAREVSIPAQLKKEQLHIAMQWTGDDLLLFINGVPTSGNFVRWKHKENPIAFIKRVTTASTSQQLRIGNFTDEITATQSEDGHFSSSVFSLRVSHGLRYTSEFTPEKFSVDAQTVALYKFDEGTGSILHDSSVNGHHGEIVEAKWVRADPLDAPGTWKPGPRENVIPGFVARPASLPGIKRWQAISNAPDSRINCVAYSPDQKEIALGCASGLIRFYDAESLKLIRVSTGHTDGVNTIAYRPDGQQIASGSIDETIRLWSVDGTPGPVMRGDIGVVRSIAYHPDGQQIVSGGFGYTVRLWSVDGTPGPVMKGHTRGVLSVAFRPDGQQIASGSVDKTIRLWSADGTPGPVLMGHTSSIWSVSYRPDGQQIASASDDKTIRLWSVDGKPEQVLKGHLSGVKAVAYSADGEKIVSGGDDNTVRLWSADGTPGPVLKGHPEMVRAVAFRPDGQQVASACFGRVIRLWSTDGASKQVLKGNTNSVKSVAYRPDGQQIASGSHDKTVRLWSTDGVLQKSLKGHANYVKSVAYRPDGKQIASGSDDHTVRLWSVDGTPEQVLKGHSKTVWSVAYRPDGEQIVSASSDETVRLWSADGTPEQVLEGHSKLVRSVAYRPDGQQIASGSDDATIRLWSLDGTPGQILERSGGAQAISYHPNGYQIASTLNVKTIQLWAFDGTAGPILKGHTNVIRSIMYRPDEKQIASASDDKTIRFWSLDGTPGLILKGHNSSVQSVAYHPDGQQIASASEDGTIRLWDVPTGDPQRTIIPLGNDQAITFTAAGELLGRQPANLDDHLVYVVESTGGGQKILTPSEFYKRYATTITAADDDDVTTSADRAVAEWVLSVRGSFETDKTTFKAGDTLPAEPFQIETISLSDQWAKLPLDQEIARLAGLTKLEMLVLFNSSIGDRGLAELRRLQLPNLIRLDISNSNVSDAGLLHLEGLRKELKGLYVDLSSISDAGLVHLGKLHKLDTLHLDATEVSDRGLEHLENMKGLRHLSLIATNVTEPGVMKLHAALPNCQIAWDGNTDSERWAASFVIRSGGTIVTDQGKFAYGTANSKLPDGPLRLLAVDKHNANDAGLRVYQACVNLESLDFSKSRVTDAGLRYLLKQEKLRLLNLVGTRVTKQGIADLQKALPDCEILWDKSASTTPLATSRKETINLKDQ